MCESENAYGILSFLWDTHLQWKWCSTQHTQWSGTQGVKFMYQSNRHQHPPPQSLTILTLPSPGYTQVIWLDDVPWGQNLTSVVYIGVQNFTPYGRDNLGRGGGGWIWTSGLKTSAVAFDHVLWPKVGHMNTSFGRGERNLNIQNSNARGISNWSVHYLSLQKELLWINKIWIARLLYQHEVTFVKFSKTIYD